MTTLAEKREARESRNALSMPDSRADALERVLIQGDLSRLDAAQRVEYVQALCARTGLDALTQPFEYLVLQGKTVLYAKKACTDQLRALHKISVVDMDQEEREGIYSVTVKVQNAEGRTDMDIGSVRIEGLKGDARANAIMKASTKAKRRATLSICGLGLLDESELDTVPNARPLPPEPGAPAGDDDVPLVTRAPSKVVNPATGHKIDPNSANQQKKNGTWERVEARIRGFDDINALTEWWEKPSTQEAIGNLARGLQEGAEHLYADQQELLAEKLKRELDGARNG